VVCPATTDGHWVGEDNVYTIGPVRSLASYASYGVVGDPIKAIRIVMKILKEEKPDIIHSNAPLTIGFAALFASKSLRIPLVGTPHTLLPEMLKYYPLLKLQTLGKILGWQLYENYYNLCDLITSPTPAVKNILLGRGVRKKIVLVPNGIDIDRFRPSETSGKLFRANHSIPNDSKVILFSGRLSFEKNVNVLITAFKKLLEDTPRASLVVLGSGPLKGALIELVKKLKLENNVLFLGEVEHQSDLIPIVYSAADIFVLPSKFENSPLSILEAMGCMKPVVATCVGGIVDLIEDGQNGLLVRPDNPDELANVLRTLATDDQECLRLGEAARKTAEAYSIESTTKTLMHYCRLLVDEMSVGRIRYSEIPNALLYCLTFFSTYSLFSCLKTLKRI
jgi:glycosyltransferase involved in cell wall biosynthesis